MKSMTYPTASITSANVSLNIFSNVAKAAAGSILRPKQGRKQPGGYPG
ncbi:MAG TPA: hypothetical protein P5175_08620 [Anaerohalosphaeraceae bacterium]|nr:hypothetical protein [Anaerohalosphaeraceae bacterium]